MENKLEKIIKFRPAYDKGKEYGIGCVTVYMVLKGKEGAVHFNFATGMFMAKTMKRLIREGTAKYEFLSKDHEYYVNKPMGYDVGFCSPTVPEGHEYLKDYPPRDGCEWNDGKPCYGDGSALRADEWFNIFVEKGDEVIWSMLEEYYKEVFLPNEAKK